MCVCVRVSPCMYLSVSLSVCACVCVCYDIGVAHGLRSLSGQQGILYCVRYQLAPIFFYNINKSYNKYENSSFCSSIIQISFKMCV